MSATLPPTLSLAVLHARLAAKKASAALDHQANRRDLHMSLAGTNARGWRTKNGDVVLAADVDGRVLYVVGPVGELRWGGQVPTYPAPGAIDLTDELAAMVRDARRV